MTIKEREQKSIHCHCCVAVCTDYDCGKFAFHMENVEGLSLYHERLSVYCVLHNETCSGIIRPSGYK